MNVKRGKYSVAMPSGRQEVEGIMVGLLGVHPYAGRFNITHLPTGYAITRARTEDEALDLAVSIQEVADLKLLASSDRESSTDGLPDDVRQAIRERNEADVAEEERLEREREEATGS